MSAEVSAGSTWQKTPQSVPYHYDWWQSYRCDNKRDRPKSQLIVCTHYIAGSKNNINTTHTKEINLTVAWCQLSTATSFVINHHRRQHYFNDIVIRVKLLLAPFSHFVSITSLPSTLTTSGVLVMTSCSLVDDSQRFGGTCCFHSLNHSSMNWFSLWEFAKIHDIPYEERKEPNI